MHLTLNRRFLENRGSNTQANTIVKTIRVHWIADGVKSLELGVMVLGFRQWNLGRHFVAGLPRSDNHPQCPEASASSIPVPFAGVYDGQPGLPTCLFRLPASGSPGGHAGKLMGGDGF